VSVPNLLALKSQWNQVLDEVLNQDRIAWLGFFDARLISLEGNWLTIGFEDSEKFGGQHDFRIARSTRHLDILRQAILEISGHNLEIIEK
jgi:hypothetical protein